MRVREPLAVDVQQAGGVVLGQLAALQDALRVALAHHRQRRAPPAHQRHASSTSAELLLHAHITPLSFFPEVLNAVALKVL